MGQFHRNVTLQYMFKPFFELTRSIVCSPAPSQRKRVAEEEVGTDLFPA